jgi:hypothetical protein
MGFVTPAQDSQGGQHGFADFASFDSLSHAYHRRIQTALADDAQSNSSLPAGRDGPVAAVQVGCQGFFNQHMDAVLRRQYDQIGMRRMGGTDGKHVDARLTEHLLTVGVSLRAVLPGKSVGLIRAVTARGYQSRLRQRRQCLGVGMPHLAAAYQRCAKGFRHAGLRSCFRSIADISE